MKEEHKAHALKMLEQIHQRFIADVKKGRGDRLKNDPTIFSGLIWTGEESIQLGLADEVGSTVKVARDVIGVEKTIDYTKHLSLPERLLETVSHTVVQEIIHEMLTLQVQ
jgi:protease-4